MKRIAVTAAAIATLLSLSAKPAQAQALADRVPQDAVAYFGWAGASALADAYGPSHLKAVLDETRVRDLFGKYLNDVEAKVTKQDPSAAEGFRLLRTLGAPMWNSPTAIFVGKPDVTNVNKPKFHFALISQAGDAAPKLSDEINALLAKGPRSDVPIHAFASGGIVCFAVGYAAPENVLASESGADSLSKLPAFANAFKQLGATKPATVSFVDAATVVASIEDAIQQKNPDVKTQVSTFLDASGLRGVQGYISAAGFDGTDWVSQALLSINGDRAGLLAAMPAGPLDPALLKTAPADATFFSSSRFDAAVFVRAMRDALGKTDEQALKYFNMGLSGAQQALGTNVVDNLLEPLGADWVFFTGPHTGSGLLGMVAVNKLDDPEKMRKALNTASVNLCNWINVGIRKGAGGNSPISVHTATTKIGDIDVNYFATPLFAPSWTIRDGKLFIGLYPQTVGAAVRQASKGGQSLADSSKYQALLKRLGNASPESSSFYDLPMSASYGSMYPQIMALVRYAGFGDLFGVTLPEPLLPPMDVLLDNLAPAGSVSWSDAAGFHSKSVTPFPGASVVSEQGAVASIGAGSGATVASILLPSLNRARETANRVKSASNLRQMGMAMVLYANENRGKLPPDLGTLVKTEDIGPDVFVNPRASNDATPPRNGDTDAGAAFVNEHSDYIYVGSGLTNTAGAETVIAYENPEGLDDGINLLFGDGHVEFYMMPAAMQLIEQSKQQRVRK